MQAETADLQAVRREHGDVFRALFVASAPLAIFWTLGFPLEGTLEQVLPALLNVSEGFMFFVFATCLYALVAGLVVWRASPIHGFLMLPRGVPIGRAVLSTAVRGLGAYLLGSPICFAIAMWVSRAEAHAGDRGVFVWLFAIWMPLWWSVPVGTVLAWRRECRRRSEAARWRRRTTRC